jgi:molybdenum cofactor synthesis domain-containing protein
MEKKQNAQSALVIIGNEILSGRTHDKNMQYIGEKMAAHGTPLKEVRVVADVESKVIEAVNALRAEYDHVFTTGGIGPTHDDITAECISKAFGVKYTTHDEAFAVLTEYYGESDFTPARQKMAKMPEGVTLIPNPISGAPGFTIGNVHVMAGIPRVMQAMLDHLVSEIAGGDPVLSKTVTSHLPESEIAEGLGDIQNKYPAVDIGSYPGFRNGKLWSSVVLRATDGATLDKATSEVENFIETLS